MFAPVLLAALVLNASDTSSTFSKVTPTTLTITDIKLSDHAMAQLPVDSSIQQTSKRVQAPVEIHIQPIDPATEIQAKVLEFSE